MLTSTNADPISTQNDNHKKGVVHSPYRPYEGYLCEVGGSKNPFGFAVVDFSGLFLTQLPGYIVARTQAREFIKIVSRAYVDGANNGIPTVNQG